MRKTVYVYFGDADKRSWYMRPMAQGFTHCFTFEQQILGGYDCFIRVENLFNYVFSSILFGGIHDLPYNGSMSTVKIIIEVDPTKKYHDFMPINCVSLVKKQLGISKPLIITPQQLHDHLITLGGKEI